MSPAVARSMAGIYADVATTDFYSRPRMRSAWTIPTCRASACIWTPGCAQISDDATIYGDWGGFNVIDATASAFAESGQV
jgi:hypothetical protein